MEYHASHRGIEGGHRLVGNDHGRPERERAGDHYPLLLTARQFMRIAGDELLRRPQPSAGQHLVNPSRQAAAHAMRRGPSATASNTFCLGFSAQAGSCSTSWTWRRCSLSAALEYRSGAAAYQISPLDGRTSPTKARAGALTTARLADERDDLASPDREVHIVDSARGALTAPCGENDPKVARLENRSAVHRTGRGGRSADERIRRPPAAG